jgi:hypothetical protein
VNKLGSTGSRVMVERLVGVNVGNGVLVISGVPVGGVVDGSAVLMTNKLGVFEACNEKGVAVGLGEPTGAETGVCRNGIDRGGKPLQLARSTSIKTENNFFIIPHQ